jgi:hypothetical protein
VRAGAETIVLGPLRAGEERVWEGRVARGRVALRGARTVSAPDELAVALRDRVEQLGGARPLRLAALAPEAHAAGVSCEGARGASPASATVVSGERLALVDARRCDVPAVPEPPAGPRAPSLADAPPRGRIERIRSHGDESALPARSLLEMLRQRIVPVARACFRDDRAGRPAYSTRATFEFELADREVVRADVQGRIAPELRACLSSAVDGLDIPRFDGTVSVRYPLYTRAEPARPTLRLDADVADAIDAIAPEEE